MQSLLALGTDEVHLWISHYSRISNEHLLRSYRELLAVDETRREQRFHFGRDRLRYLATRAMVRTVLSRYASIHPKAWTFSIGPYGKPKIANPEVMDEDLSFNLSHTQSLIAFAVTKRRTLGVDAENWCVREVSIDIANHFFSPQEVTALSAVPKLQQQYRFFEYWTFKEAYIKAKGIGLSLPLDRFTFSYPSDTAVDLAFRSDLRDDSSQWQLWQLRPAPEYLVAVCAERTGGKTCNLTVREVIPGVEEKLLSLAFTRTSQ